MAQNFRHFIQDYLMLVSALKNDAEMRRTVTVNLESKITSSQWRIVVLSRLHQLLDVILKEKMKRDEYVCCCYMKLNINTVGINIVGQ